MRNLIILIIVIIIFLNVINYILAEPFVINKTRQYTVLPYMIPFNSAFKSKFNKIKTQDLTFGYSSYQEKSLYNYLTHDTSIHSKFVYDVMQNSSIIDIGILPENQIQYYQLNRKFDSNWRFVTSLYQGNFLLLCSDQVPIIDISQIRLADNQKPSRPVRINANIRNSAEHIFIRMLIRELQLNNFELTFYTNETLIQMFKTGKVDICIVLSAHKSMIIDELSKVTPAHFISVRKLNNGDLYHYTLSEETFYRDHIVYHKGIIDQSLIVPQHYPYVSILDKNSNRYIPIITTKYLLLCKQDIIDSTINYLIARLLLLLKDRIYLNNELNRYLLDVRINFTKLPIKMHNSAYKIINLITDDTNDYCIHYHNGLCPKVKPELLTLKAKPLNNITTSDYINNYLRIHFQNNN